MSREYKPDKLKLLRLEKDGEVRCRVLGGWSGGYLDGDSWRLSSVVDSIKDCNDYYEIKNASGSVYICGKGSEGTNVISAGIYSKMLEQAKDENIDIKEILPEDFIKEFL